MKRIIVNDRMQKGYQYVLSEQIGKNFHVDFSPELTPKEMLELGVFGGKYMNDCQSEFPEHWFVNAKLSLLKKDININFYKVDASLPLSTWKTKGWIFNDDPRGWFQWYCRYFMGRRIVLEDIRQINRWRSMKRHIGLIRNNCVEKDHDCRKKTRQALLHWAYDSRKI
tara:strand:- start:2051 stop:2554 length:504 start_codon:yes stop_codon:yes gene_type:complete